MADRPARSPRMRKRVPVRFGTTHELAGRGFTINVSAQGMAIATNVLPKLGSRLYLEMGLGTKACRAEGQIAWAQRGIGQAGSVGVRLTRADEDYFQFIFRLGTTDRTTSSSTAAAPPAQPDSPPKPKVTSKPPPIRSVVYIPPATTAPKAKPYIEPEAARLVEPEPARVVEPEPAPTLITSPEEVLQELPDYLTMLHDGAPASSDPAEEFSPEWWMPPEDELDAETTPHFVTRPQLNREPRVSAKLPIQFGVGLALDREGTTINLSSTGLAVSVPVPAEPGEMVVFAINGADGVTRGAGWVVWVREIAAEPPETLIGLRLIQGDSRYPILLESLARR